MLGLCTEEFTTRDLVVILVVFCSSGLGCAVIIVVAVGARKPCLVLGLCAVDMAERGLVPIRVACCSYELDCVDGSPVDSALEFTSFTGGSTVVLFLPLTTLTIRCWPGDFF